MKDSYSLSYGKYSKYPARRYSYNLRLNFVKKALTECNCNIILDLGSATGDYDIDLKDEGFCAILVDVNSKCLRIAKNKDKNIIIVNANACSLPFNASSFCAVIIINALRYFDNPLACLRECNRVLKNKGCLIIIDHNKYCPDTLLIRHDVVRYFSLKELKELLHRSGFKLIENYMLFIPPPFAQGYILNLILKISSKLNKLQFLKKIYPEIYIQAIKK
jgi:ubiquinone/menaquinone biosynthesis C-methylase UbiE